MAIKLDTSLSEAQTKALQQEMHNTRFKVIKIVIGALIGLVAVWTAVVCIFTHKDYTRACEMYDAYQAEYETVLKEKAESDKLTMMPLDDEGEDDGPKLEAEKIQMNSAREAGELVARLQTEYVMGGNNGYLPNEQKEQLSAHLSDVRCWYGEKLDPTVSPIIWKFVTEYDSTSDNYNTLFVCYTEDMRYILETVEASYSATTDKFTVTDTLLTIFGQMYQSYGAIETSETVTGEDGDEYDVTDEVDSIKDKLEDLLGDSADIDPDVDGYDPVYDDMGIDSDPDQGWDDLIAFDDKSTQNDDDGQRIDRSAYKTNTYVVNKGNNVIHYSGCPEVEKIADPYEMPTSAATISALRDMYDSCKKCDPLGIYATGTGDIWVLDLGSRTLHHGNCEKVSSIKDVNYYEIPKNSLTVKQAAEAGYNNCKKCKSLGDDGSED